MEGTRQSSTEQQQPLRASDVDQNMPAVVDRLSNLGDELLCHILSFVPTKLSVSTSILAKRWRFIWAHVPVLDFSEPDYFLHWQRSSRFSKIINRVLLLHRMRSLDTLRLVYTEQSCNETYCEEDCNVFEFETWIATAIERNVRNLDLCTKIESFVWPLSLFTCKTLVHLKLFESILPCFSGPVSLPSLKKFWFKHIDFSADEVIPHLLPGCPVLDEFTFESYDYAWGDVDSFKTCVAIRRPAAYNYSRMMEIRVEDSSELELAYYVASHISGSMITSIVEAKVEIYRGRKFGNLDVEIVVLMKLLDVFCQVKCLSLSLYLMSSSEIQLFPRFDNCTRLELAVNWALLMKFLENADNLEVLITCNILEVLITCNITGDHYYIGSDWTEPKQVPTCLFSCLGTIWIKDFGCTEPEFEMVRYFLMNARVLKQMKINFSDKEFGLEARLDAMRKLALFRRGSEACELVIH